MKSIHIRDMEPRDSLAAATMVVASEIGTRYGFSVEGLGSSLSRALGGDDELFVAELEGAMAGFAWVDPRGAFSTAPYLRLIAVDPGLRSGGVGGRLLGEFEARTARVGRPFCLLVSDFNRTAQAFYEARGYRKVGSLPDFARPGIAEILMMKPSPRNLS